MFVHLPASLRRYSGDEHPAPLGHLSAERGRCARGSHGQGASSKDPHTSRGGKTTWSQEGEANPSQSCAEEVFPSSLKQYQRQKKKITRKIQTCPLSEGKYAEFSKLPSISVLSFRWRAGGSCSLQPLGTERAKRPRGAGPAPRPRWQSCPGTKPTVRGSSGRGTPSAPQHAAESRDKRVF